MIHYTFFIKSKKIKTLINLLISCGYLFSLDIAMFSNMLYILGMSQTYQPNRRKRAKTHGFLVRTKTKDGRKINTARRRKGRTNVSVKK